MKRIEPAKQDARAGLSREIREFWTDNVNAERIMGRPVTRSQRGEEQYFTDLETQRYRSHRHLLPWISAMESSGSVLEIGCGVGLDTFQMATRGMQVKAVDLTDVGVKTASKRLTKHKLPATFAAADACNLPFGNDTFNYVYSFGVLHHVADTDRSIHEVYRVLKKGGEARIMLYHRRSINEIVHRLTRTPFEEKDKCCPVVRRFTIEEVRKLFDPFSQVDIFLDYAYGEGYGRLFKLTPAIIHRFLSRRWGWHIMITAKK
ncbi:MAG: class I SAM-dependent methyltransferase [Gammaproteobacteria bacterium]